MGTFWAATEADEEEKEADAKVDEEEEEEEEAGQARRQLQEPVSPQTMHGNNLAGKSCRLALSATRSERGEEATVSPLKGNGCCRERGRSLARDGVDEEGLVLG